MSTSSSVLSSLGAALPLIFNGRSSPSTIYPTFQGHPLMNAFKNHLCEKLRRLQDHGQYLTAEWLKQALEAVLSVHSQAKEIFPHNHQAVLRQNSKWINDHLDETVKLLDVCHALRETMTDIRHYIGTLQLVVHSLCRVSLDPGQLLRARTVMNRFLRFPKAKEAGKFQLENYSSMLRRIGEKLVPPPPPPGGDNSRGKVEFLEAIHASTAFTVFVCSVMVAELSITGRRSVVAPPCAGSWAWGCELQSLYGKVKDEMDKRRSKNCGRPLLQELETVETTARSLYESVERLINTKSMISLNDNKEKELRQSVQCLKKGVAELEQGMAPFEKHINELFRVLISRRMALLDILSYS